MEYLMTYGWAILIILIALGALFYLGIFSPKGQNTVSVDAPFAYLDMKFSEDDDAGNIVIGIADIVGNVDSALTAEGDCGTAVWASNPQPGKTNEIILSNCGDLTDGQRVSGTVTITYALRGGISHTKTLKYSGYVEAGEISSPPPVGTCGDNNIDAGETCDGTDLGGETCVSQGYDSGTLACLSDCSFDYTNCVSAGTCGDNNIDAGETCDGTDLGGETCVSQGYDSGTLACLGDCSAYDYTNCFTPTGNIYYVDELGDNSNQGTQAEPFRTIHYAAGVVGPGDAVYVNDGNYTDQSWDGRTHILVSGTSGNPIIFKALGNNVLTKGFRVLGDYIHIDGFQITRWGIHIEECNYCEITNNVIHNVSRAGITLLNNPRYEDNPSSSHCLIKGNKISYPVQCGILIMGQNHIVEDNEVSHTTRCSSFDPYCDDADGMRMFGSGHLIKGNYIHDITHDESLPADPHIDCFQTWETLRDILFEDNYCESSDTYGSNQILMFTQTAGEIIEDITFRRNIFVMSDPGYIPMNFLGGHGDNSERIRDIKIINNNFIHFSPEGIANYALQLTRVDGAIFKNNILIDYAANSLYFNYTRCPENCENIDISNNLIYNPSGIVPINPNHPNDVWLQDPLFIDMDGRDFHLQSGSPAIDAGVDVGLPYSGSAPDIGAFEY